MPSGRLVAEVEVVDAVDVEVDTDEHEAIDEVGTTKRDEHRHDAAIAPSHEMDLRRDADTLEQPDGVDGHVVVVERLVRVGGVAVAATIECDDAEALLEVRADRVEEVVAVAEAAVQQHQRVRTASASLSPGAHTVDVDAVRHAASSPVDGCRVRACDAMVALRCRFVNRLAPETPRVNPARHAGDRA